MTTATNVLRKRKWPLWLIWGLALCSLAGLSWLVYDGLTFQPSGEIAYECDFPERPPQICLINASGSSQRAIALPELGVVDSPTWSPDGHYLAFIGLKDDFYTIYKFSLSDQTFEKVWSAEDKTPTTVMRHIIWSPDGTWLLLHASVKDIPGLYKLDLNKPEIENDVLLITQTEVVSRARPAFYDGGKRLYYMDSIETAPFERASVMYSATINGDNREKVIPICAGIAISMVDEKILCRDNGGFTIRETQKWNGESFTNLSIIISGFENPAWSPDGQYIVYSQTHWPAFMGDDNGELWIMRADGSHPVKLTNGPADRNPAWRPEP